MKKIAIPNLDEIKEKHFKYCKQLTPLNGRKIDDKLCRFLCCENPFDMENFNPQKPESIELIKDYRKYIGSGIDYKKFYASFRTPDLAPKRNEKWNGIELLKSLKVEVCPYCGMNYISPIVKKDGKLRAVATLDHYLPESVFNFLALNLYNLIPSCKNCNSTFKLNSSKSILHPYFLAPEDFINFSIEPEDVTEEILYKDSKPKIALIYDAENELIKNHNEVLMLQARYEYFSNIAKTLIAKRRKYTDSYLSQLESVFKNFSKIQFEKDLINQDFYSKDEIFSKFKSDIWKQLSKK